MKFILKKSKFEGWSLLYLESGQEDWYYVWKILNFKIHDKINPKLSVYIGKKKIDTKFINNELNVISKGLVQHRFSSKKMLTINFKSKDLNGVYNLRNVNGKKWIISCWET